MFKPVFKFILGFLMIAGLGAAGILLVRYFGSRGSEEYKAKQELQKLEKRYAEDPYGGDTPEETLRLFIDALKKEDVDLASKYFVLDKQEEWRNELLIIKEKGLLDEMVVDLKKTEMKADGNAAFFTLLNEDGFESQLVMHKNPLNGKWKITEL